MQPTISLMTTISPLIWRVSADYELIDVPGVAGPTVAHSSDADTDISSSGDIRLHRYSILAGGRTNVEALDERTYQPTAVPGERSAFLDLANTVASTSVGIESAAATASVRERVCAFVKDWGLLSTGTEASLYSFLLNARQIRKALKDAEANGWSMPAGKGRTLRGIALESDGTLKANTLLQFCWLELFLAVKRRTPFFRCGNRQCGKYGLQREPGLPGPARKYCCDNCRKKAERARAA